MIVEHLILGVLLILKRQDLFLIKFIKRFSFFNVMVNASFDEYGNKIINERGSVSFKCPACGDAEISRSRNARELSKEYKCPKCGFVGP